MTLCTHKLYFSFIFHERSFISPSFPIVLTLHVEYAVGKVVFPFFTISSSCRENRCCTQGFLFFWIISTCRSRAAFPRNFLTSELSHANHRSLLPAPTEGLLSPDHKPLHLHGILHFFETYFQYSFALQWNTNCDRTLIWQFNSKRNKVIMMKEQLSAGRNVHRFKVMEVDEGKNGSKKLRLIQNSLKESQDYNVTSPVCKKFKVTTQKCG